MNKNNASQYLPFVQALAEGLPIQYHVGGDCWQHEPSPSFAQAPERYRVAPNPYQHLIDALNAGKQIETRYGKEWRLSEVSAKIFEECGQGVLLGDYAGFSNDYRVKPDEPKTIWVNETEGYNHFYTSKQAALYAVGATAKRIAVKYVEAKE